jgi:hypothetical protein
LIELQAQTTVPTTFRNSNLVGMANEATLVIDGKSLHFTLSKDLRKPFIDLCTSCKAVICCRVSPIQKAEMVELVSFPNKLNGVSFNLVTDICILNPVSDFLLLISSVAFPEF